MSCTQDISSLTPENVVAILTELNELRATVAESQNKISTLEKQIDYLKDHITITESKLAIAKHVSSTLHKQIDNQEQYSRRKCLIFEGIKVEEKEKNSDLKMRILNVIQKEFCSSIFNLRILIKLIALVLQRVTNKILSSSSRKILQHDIFTDPWETER